MVGSPAARARSGSRDGGFASRPLAGSRDGVLAKGGGLTELHMNTSGAASPKLPSAAKPRGNSTGGSPRRTSLGGAPRRNSSGGSPSRAAASKVASSTSSSKSISKEAIGPNAGLAFGGAMLLVYGLGWGSICLVQAHPFVLFVIAGVVCLGLSAFFNYAGLVRFMPEGLKHTLLERTPFDLIVDDAGITRQIRRWVRILMLAGAKSEKDVESITCGLADGDDPEFLDRVLRRGIVHSLPPGLKRILLPNEGSVAVQTPSITSLLAEGSILGSREITTILRKKAAQKKSIFDTPGFPPPLAPVVQSLAISASAEGLSQFNCTVRSLVHRGMQVTFAVSTAASVFCGMAAVFFRTQMSRRMLQGLSASGGAMLQRLTVSASDAPAVAASFFTAQHLVSVSALGAGASLVLALQLRLRWIPRASSAAAAAATQLSVVEGRRTGCEPDPEQSPEIWASAGHLGSSKRWW